MAFNGNPTRTWDQNTPADGDLFNAEFLRSYENHNEHYNFAVAQINIQRGIAQGRVWVDPTTPSILYASKNNVYEVDGNLIRLTGQLQLDFSSLTNIYRNDGTTGIAATSETQNKHLYLLMTTSGSLHAMIVPDAEMEGSSHVYANNTKLVEDYYNAIPSIWDSAKNGYYKNGKRIIAVLRLNSSNQVDFHYELGHGHRYMDVQHLAIGNKYVETRWKREHPACYVPDGSTITNMSTEAPVLNRILGTNVLPDWRDRFPRNIDIAGSRSIRDTQEDAFQGFKMRSTTASWATTGGTGIPTTGGSVGTVLLEMSLFLSDGTNGTPRVDNETRGKNYAESNQIVRG